MSLNKVILIGNVGKDPEVRHLDNGAIVASFSLATSERFKDRSGELKSHTEWHSITCWRSLADLADKYIRKGSQIYVEGRIRSRSWEDQNGVKHTAIDILADSIQLLGKRSDNQDSQAPRDNSYTAPVQKSNISESNMDVNISDLNGDDSDDLPF